MPSPRVNERRDIEQPADRRRGDLVGEMHKVADEPPWSRERKIASFRLVHPCTSERVGPGSRGDPLLTRSQVSVRTACVGARPAVIENGGPKGTGNGPKWEGEARPIRRCQDASHCSCLGDRWAHTLRAGLAGVGMTPKRLIPCGRVDRMFMVGSPLGRTCSRVSRASIPV